MCPQGPIFERVSIRQKVTADRDFHAGDAGTYGKGKAFSPLANKSRMRSRYVLVNVIGPLADAFGFSVLHPDVFDDGAKYLRGRGTAEQVRWRLLWLFLPKFIAGNTLCNDWRVS